MPPPVSFTRRGVRRFLLEALDLDHDGAYHPGRTTAAHVRREIRRLEVVQEGFAAFHGGADLNLRCP